MHSYHKKAMKCWKFNCSDEAAFLCPCSDAEIYSCKAHITKHLLIRAKKAHMPEALCHNQYLESKAVLCGYLSSRNAELSKLQSKIIDTILQEIKKLNSQLKAAIDEIKRVKDDNWWK